MTELSYAELLKKNEMLENRIKELEELVFLQKEEATLIPIGQTYRNIFNMSPCGIGITHFEDGTIYDVNDSFCQICGFSKDELIGKTTVQLNFYKDHKDREKVTSLFMRNGGYRNLEVNFNKKDGTAVTIIQSAELITVEDRQFIIATHLDITDRMKDEEELKRYAKDLEEANTALRVFMNRKDRDQKALEESLQFNVNDLVVPYLKKLREAKLDDYYKNCLTVLESNLSNIVSPFMVNFMTAYKKMTPQEIQIVDLIRKGMDTKDIAEMLHASIHTIATHRNNIRKKLALRNSKMNLRSYLLSLNNVY